MSFAEKEVHSHHEIQHHDVPATHMPGLPGHMTTSYPVHQATAIHAEDSIDSNKGLTLADVEAIDLADAQLLNPWSRFRHKYGLRELFAEFLGTMVLIIFGTGVDCQVVLSGLAKGSYLSISFGWGIGVMAGIYVAGGISGGHLNPVVTACLGIYRGFPKKKILPYAAAQTLGAFCGALITQGLYSGAINLFEGGAGVRTFGLETSTAALWFTAPAAHMTNVACFFSEFSATAILIIVVFALGDPKNLPPPPGSAPLILLFLILGLGAALGWQTAYALNPARDFGPRLALLCLGYPKEIFTFRHAYWLWTPIIATTCGGITGGFIYDFLLFDGESPLNAAWGTKQVKDSEKY